MYFRGTESVFNMLTDNVPSNMQLLRLKKLLEVSFYSLIILFEEFQAFKDVDYFELSVRNQEKLDYFHFFYISGLISCFLTLGFLSNEQISTLFGFLWLTIKHDYLNNIIASHKINRK